MKKTRHENLLPVRVMATGVIAISALSFFGHIVGQKVLYQWTILPGMALNTAVCFLMVGSSLLLLTKRED